MFSDCWDSRFFGNELETQSRCQIIISGCKNTSDSFFETQADIFWDRSSLVAGRYKLVGTCCQYFEQPHSAPAESLLATIGSRTSTSSLSKMHLLAPFVLLSLRVACAFAASYSLRDNFIGTGFLSGFEHEAIPDPTNGRVNYVDQGTALANNLTFASGDTFVMRADSTTTLNPSGPGRNSVRIRSLNTYTTHVVV